MLDTELKTNGRAIDKVHSFSDQDKNEKQGKRPPAYSARAILLASCWQKVWAVVQDQRSALTAEAGVTVTASCLDLGASFALALTLISKETKWKVKAVAQI